MQQFKHLPLIRMNFFEGGDLFFKYDDIYGSLVYNDLIDTDVLGKLPFTYELDTFYDKEIEKILVGFVQYGRGFK